MSTESRLREVTDSEQTVTITFANEKPVLDNGTSLQQATGRITSTNSPDVVEFQPTEGAPVPIPVSRIMIIE